ncbi:hypothetical protein CISG_00303 [Coccidioides immitis RMSCC 3703]|uniref:Uncharacterized protein n=1 Tax=Coccidioides immitis RMSCC 3703 TaxID=454286 RepID=A0A0J8QI09_COCIT|nr:hypothetical protein CISG_00303 [Coccidioides immitis RMSCC 3703]
MLKPKGLIDGNIQRLESTLAGRFTPINSVPEPRHQPTRPFKGNHGIVRKEYVQIATKIAITPSVQMCKRKGLRRTKATDEWYDNRPDPPTPSPNQTIRTKRDP